jgi:hypothetical protein
VRPVGLDKEFHKLSGYIKFIQIGSVDLKLFNFEHSTSIGFELKLFKPNSNTWARAGKELGRPSYAPMRSGQPNREGPTC